jgi:hypothetical protein
MPKRFDPQTDGDWRAALAAAPSAPSELLAFAATQSSLAETWQHATQPDWLVWMVVNGFAGDNTPRDIVQTTVIVADYARPPAWRLALRLRADDEDALRMLAGEPADFDLTQLLAHVYLGCAVGTIAGMAAYWCLARHSLVARELAGAAVLVAVAIVVSVAAFRISRLRVAATLRA